VCDSGYATDYTVSNRKSSAWLSNMRPSLNCSLLASTAEGVVATSLVPHTEQSSWPLAFLALNLCLA
jgi:hypothetical protein